MPRDANGNYTLPLPDVAGGTTIQSSWANTTMDDVAQSITDSLDRYGRGGMIAPFAFADGAASAPGASWSNEPNTGLWRAGAGDLQVTVTGLPSMQWKADGAYMYADGAFKLLATQEELEDKTLPDGTADNDRLVWDESGLQQWTVVPELAAGGVPYDNATSGLTADNVQAAVDEVDGRVDDVEANKADDTALTAHVSDTTIHAPLTGASSFEVVASLPGTTVAGVLYFVTT